MENGITISTTTGLALVGTLATVITFLYRQLISAKNDLIRIERADKIYWRAVAFRSLGLTERSIGSAETSLDIVRTKPEGNGELL